MTISTATSDAPSTTEQVEMPFGVATGVPAYEHVPAAAVALDATLVPLLGNRQVVAGG